MMYGGAGSSNSGVCQCQGWSGLPFCEMGAASDLCQCSGLFWLLLTSGDCSHSLQVPPDLDTSG